MCIYCFISCKCIGQITFFITKQIIIFVLLEYLVAIYVSPRDVVITGVSCMWCMSILKL